VKAHPHRAGSTTTLLEAAISCIACRAADSFLPLSIPGLHSNPSFLWRLLRVGDFETRRGRAASSSRLRRSGLSRSVNFKIVHTFPQTPQLRSSQSSFHSPLTFLRRVTLIRLSSRFRNQSLLLRSSHNSMWLRPADTQRFRRSFQSSCRPIPQFCVGVDIWSDSFAGNSTSLFRLWV
jgi:hypothetical protein